MFNSDERKGPESLENRCGQEQTIGSKICTVVDFSNKDVFIVSICYTLYHYLINKILHYCRRFHESPGSFFFYLVSS